MSVSQVRIGTSIRFRQVSEGRPPTDAQSVRTCVQSRNRKGGTTSSLFNRLRDTLRREENGERGRSRNARTKKRLTAQREPSHQVSTAKRLRTSHFQ